MVWSCAVETRNIAYCEGGMLWHWKAQEVKTIVQTSKAAKYESASDAKFLPNFWHQRFFYFIFLL